MNNVLVISLCYFQLPVILSRGVTVTPCALLLFQIYRLLSIVCLTWSIYFLLSPVTDQGCCRGRSDRRL